MKRSISFNPQTAACFARRSPRVRAQQRAAFDDAAWHQREFKPEVPEAAQGLDAKAEDNYFTAKEIAEAASLPASQGGCAFAVSVARSRADEDANRWPANPRRHTTSGLECSRGQQRTEREKNGGMRARNGDFGRGVLKRPRRETAPTLAFRAKKSQPIPVGISNYPRSGSCPPLIGS
jgi:hypothetical protein